MTSQQEALAIRVRLDGLVRRLYGPLITALRISMAVAVVAIAGSVAIGVLAHDPRLGAMVAAVVTLGGGVVAWSWLLDGSRRGALELALDHDCHERWEWRVETGTKLPTTPSGARNWLASHPSGKGRASMLVRLGRLDEAAVEISRIEPATPEEAFGVEVLSRQREFLAGSRPDLAPLHAAWRSLPDPRERRHRRECLALLDALIAVSDGADGWPILADARREIGEVHRSVRAPWLVARWAAIQLAVVASATILTVVIVG